MLTGVLNLDRALNDKIHCFLLVSAFCIVVHMKKRKDIYRLTGMVKAAG
jgi:hypothetical protein